MLYDCRNLRTFPGIAPRVMYLYTYSHAAENITMSAESANITHENRSSTLLATRTCYLKTEIYLKMTN